MSTFHQYDPSKVIFTWALLTAPITGYAKGTFIKVSRDEDAWKKNVGATGETTRVQNRNRAGTIEITLKQGSQSNAMLSVLAQIDENTGASVAPGGLMDMSGQTPQTLAAAAHMWIRKIAPAAFAGEEEETRVWIFDTDNLEMFVGGN